MERTVWLVNKSEKAFEKTSIELKKHIIFKPFIPQQIPTSLAMRWAKQYQSLEICANPDIYFDKVKLKQLIIRDAGIGDLLLLEPILRQLVIDGKREITVLTRYPEVYENNPYIKETFKQDRKDVIPREVQMQVYDAMEDLRGYSETCTNREKKNRTDCYNQKFNIGLSDPEPRLYFKSGVESKLKKEDDKIYIGLVCDGSHCYRRYSKGPELIEYLLKQNKNYVIVLIGTYDYVKIKKNPRVIDLQGKTTIRECFKIVRDLDYLISVDTGIMHVGLSMHIPTVCIFSIIKPELRLHYYKGPHQVIYKKELGCIGCGSYHMANCKHKGKSDGEDYISPCLQIQPDEIFEKLQALEFTNDRRLFHSDEKVNIKKPEKIKSELRQVNIIKHGKEKLTMPIIVLNEEKNLPRFIELVMKHPTIGKVIAIDGGSKDKTIKLLKKAGADVYEHYYDRNYHDMQALQRNISCSFVKDGERVLIMDIDECFSKELSDYLPELASNGAPEYGLISRRTYKYYADINDPRKRIKDYPDFQPRFYRWNRRFKFAGSPHHVTYNTPEPVKIQKDIIHFEAEGKDRDGLERQWSQMWKASRKIYD